MSSKFTYLVIVYLLDLWQITVIEAFSRKPRHCPYFILFVKQKRVITKILCYDLFVT
jgi:hypothetical protein